MFLLPRLSKCLFAAAAAREQCTVGHPSDGVHGAVVREHSHQLAALGMVHHHLLVVAAAREQCAVGRPRDGLQSPPLAISAPSGDHTMADMASLCANSRIGIGGDVSFSAAGLPPPPHGASTFGSIFGAARWGEGEGER